jgi:hypothetical protein
MANSVVTKACQITHGPSTMEKLKVGDTLVNPAAALLAEITAAGGTVRAAANPSVNAREVLGEGVAASNASG